MFNIENKENDVKSQEERASKLLGEPVHQKVRRSVLKEFDPFAPDSPLPQKVRQPVLEEEEIFEDAETSLPSYLCPINKSASELTPSRRSYGTRESLLIPELKDYRPGQLLNLNETFELSYSECVEDLSQLRNSEGNVTSSDDFEFNYKPKVGAAVVTTINDSADHKTSLMDAIFENKLSDGLPELFNEVKNTNKEGGGTPCRSNDETILKLEQPAEVGETSAAEKDIKLGEIKKIDAKKCEEDTISPPKESPKGTVSSLIEMEGTVNDERMNHTFEPSLKDENADNDEINFSGENVDVNEIMFVDTQMDRTCEATFYANDPLNGLDPLNVETDNSGYNRLEEHVDEKAQINDFETETVPVGHNDTIDAHFEASKDVHLERSFEGDSSMHHDADSHMIQTAEEKETVDNDKPSPKACANMSSEESHYTNKRLEEPELLSRFGNPSKALETGDGEIFANNEESTAKYDQPQNNSETLTELTEYQGEDDRNRSEQLLEVCHPPTAEATHINVEKIESQVKVDDKTTEAGAGENIECEHQPMKEAVGDRSPQSSDNNDLLVVNDDLGEANLGALAPRTNEIFEESQCRNEIFAADNQITSNFADESVANEDEPRKTEDITSNPPLETADANKSFDANNRGSTPESGQPRDNYETLIEAADYQEKGDQNRSEQLLEVSHPPAVEASAINVEEIDLQPLSSGPMKAGAGQNVERENQPVQEAVEDRSSQSSDNNSLLVENDDLVEKYDGKVHNELHKIAEQKGNVTEITHEPLDTNFVVSNNNDVEQTLPEPAEAGSSEKTVESSDMFNNTFSGVPKYGTNRTGSTPGFNQSQNNDVTLIEVTDDQNGPERLLEVSQTPTAEAAPVIIEKGDLKPLSSKPVKLDDETNEADAGENIEREYQPMNEAVEDCNIQSSDNDILHKAEESFKTADDELTHLDASSVMNSDSVTEQGLPERTDEGLSEKVVESSDEFSETVPGVANSDLPSSENPSKSPLLPAETNSYQIGIQGEEKEVDRQQQANHESDEPQPDVGMESPEKEELSLAQFNKTLGSNGEASVPDSHSIGHQTCLKEDCEILPKDHQNTPQPPCKPKTSGEPALIETELAKLEGSDLNQPPNASYVIANNHSDVKLNIPESIDAGSSEYSTFETPDDEANVSKSGQKDTELNVSEEVALIPSGKTFEEPNSEELPIDTNVLNCHQSKLEGSSEIKPGVTSTLEEESPDKEEPASTQLSKTFDSNVQESVPESHSVGHLNLPNSDQRLLADAEFGNVKDESLNQPLTADVVLASGDCDTSEVDGVAQKYDQGEAERVKIIDESLNQPPSVKTSDDDTESSEHLNKTFEAATEVIAKLSQSDNESENGEGHSNLQPLLVVGDVNPQSNSKAVDAANCQPISVSENRDDIKESAISSFEPETGQSESERAVEALARSLNQTIDFEEPSIVEDIDSTDTSSDNLNATIENVTNNRQDCRGETENRCGIINSPPAVDVVVDKRPKIGCVEQIGSDEHDSNDIEEKITKDMMKTENTEKSFTEAESMDKKPVNENTKLPNRRIECRPNIRSLRNKTQVITNPLLLKSEQMKNVTTSAPASDVNEKLLNDYKRRNDQLLNDVNRLQVELDKLHEDTTRKDQSILSYALSREADRDNILKYRKVIKTYEEHIVRQKEELVLLKAENDKLARHFTNTEMAFSELFEKYEKAKLVIEAYRKNEAILIENITNAENQLVQLDAKCKAMQDQCNRDLERARKQIDQEEENYKQSIAKLQAMVKRLEIKASSLETSLKQKTEECQALAALCDDITGNQPS